MIVMIFKKMTESTHWPWRHPTIEVEKNDKVHTLAPWRHRPVEDEKNDKVHTLAPWRHQPIEEIWWKKNLEKKNLEKKSEN